MKLAHPWKDILFGQMEQMEKTQPIESTDIQDMQSSNQVIFLPLFVSEKKANTPTANSNQKAKFIIHMPDSFSSSKQSQFGFRIVNQSGQ